MALSLRPPVTSPTAVNNPLIPYPNTLHSPSLLSKTCPVHFKSSLNCQCLRNETTDEPTKGFSVLSSDVPWERGSIWTSMAFYMFNLHIPLGVGGLSIVAYVFHQPDLDPQTEALSLLVIQILELTGALVLLKSTARPQVKLAKFFQGDKLAEERNWILASALGFGFLILLVYLTSFLLDGLVGAKAVNNPMLKEMLLSSNLAKSASVLVYCLVTPLLEETVYRGFLLTSLASMMNWQQAVFLSSAVFSAAHASGENFLQLFIIGCVLGCCYCWTGKLSSSFVVHSLYNAVTLIISCTS